MPPEVLPWQIAAPQNLTLLTLLFQQYEDVGSTPGEIPSLERDGLVRALALVSQRTTAKPSGRFFTPRTRSKLAAPLLHFSCGKMGKACRGCQPRLFRSVSAADREDCVLGFSDMRQNAGFTPRQFPKLERFGGAHRLA